MIKKLSQILFFFFFLFGTTRISAQFINLQLTVEPELSATVVQPLDFGTQVTNSGEISVGLGDVSMGVFEIRAFHTQNIYIDLTYPDYLLNENPEINDRIPLNLRLAYNNSGTNNPANSEIVSGNNGLISIHESSDQSQQNKIWQNLYLYVYGSINIGNIANGPYTGDIVLSVDYD